MSQLIFIMIVDTLSNLLKKSIYDGYDQWGEGKC